MIVNKLVILPIDKSMKNSTVILRKVSPEECSTLIKEKLNTSSNFNQKIQQPRRKLPKWLTGWINKSTWVSR